MGHLDGEGSGQTVVLLQIRRVAVPDNHRCPQRHRPHGRNSDQLRPDDPSQLVQTVMQRSHDSLQSSVPIYFHFLVPITHASNVQEWWKQSKDKGSDDQGMPTGLKGDRLSAVVRSY